MSNKRARTGPSTPANNPLFPPPPEGTRNDGIRTMEDLLGRCRRDKETGCMLYSGAKSGPGRYAVWLPTMRAVTLHTALWILTTGHKPPKAGANLLIPRCGNANCCEMKHRFAGTRAEHSRLLRPTLSLPHRARISVGNRKAWNVCTAEIAEQVRSYPGSGSAAARAFGISRSLACNIKRGTAWGPIKGASVFSVSRESARKAA